MKSCPYHTASSEESHLYIEYWSCLLDSDHNQKSQLKSCIDSILDISAKYKHQSVLCECQELPDKCSMHNGNCPCEFPDAEVQREFNRIPESINVAFVVQNNLAKEHVQLISEKKKESGHIRFFNNLEEASSWLFA